MVVYMMDFDTDDSISTARMNEKIARYCGNAFVAWRKGPRRTRLFKDVPFVQDLYVCNPNESRNG